MGIRKYKVTDLVGDFVLGQPTPKDRVLEADEDAAANDVRLGYLEPIEDKPIAPKAK